MPYKINYEDGFSATYQTKKAFADAVEAKNVLTKAGWKLLGWSANEGLFVTGAWKEVNGFVFCIANADDNKGGVNLYDNFSAPDSIRQACQVFVYQRPFQPADIGNGEIIHWEMDGSAPVNNNSLDEEIMAPFFRGLDEAFKFCEWVAATAEPDAVPRIPSAGGDPN